MRRSSTLWQIVRTSRQALLGVACCALLAAASGAAAVEPQLAISGTFIALRTDGTVWSWGYGDLGDGSQGPRGFPAQVPDLAGVVSVAGAAQTSLVAKSDGTGWP